MLVHHPDESFSLIKGIWRYLAGSSDVYLECGTHNTNKGLAIFTDASFAPGGDRSGSGATVFWRGGLVLWYSKRQPLTTLSTPESELGGAIPGIKFGI